MAYNDDQNDFPLPAGDNEGKRQSSEFLPKYFRTKANQKFLSSTLDQLIQPGVAEKINAYYGRKTAKSFKPSDSYVEDVSIQRENRQLEPVAVVKDNLDNVLFHSDYTDLVNQVKSFNGNVDNQSLLNSQEYYSWDPAIDWDKFVNFREYYWLPNGPQTVSVFGQTTEVTSTYTVTTEVQDDNTVYKFSPPGFTPNPSLKLYRGQTYRFEIDCPGHPIAFAVNRTFLPGDAVVVYENQEVSSTGRFDVELFDAESFDFGENVISQDLSLTFEADENISSVYEQGITYTDADGNAVSGQTVYIEKGVIEFKIPTTAPDRLYYISQNSIDTSGLFKIYDIEEASEIDVANEILGKKTYTSGNGIEFTNGLKVQFGGNVTPEKYATGEWYVEGVGSAITLVAEEELDILTAYTDVVEVPFDSDQFDRLPFNNANSYAGTKDYIVINRSSIDKNPWSRYNKWFHKDVIEKSSAYNGEVVSDIDQTARAKRPIVEFEAGLKLYNFGSAAKGDIDLIDTFTKDVFSTIEGSLGYNVDGVALAQDMRILFTADTDKMVNGKIYTVNFVKIGNDTQISLIEADDTLPLDNEVVLVKNGTNNAGTLYYYNGTTWNACQTKDTTNQPPLFALYDNEGNSFTDETYYESSNFAGCKVFSYRVGTQEADDAELGFPLDYRTIENVGDIIFDFNLLTDGFTYQVDNNLEYKSTDVGFLRKHSDRTTFNTQNSWKKANKESEQYVITQFVSSTDERVNFFPVDCFDRSADLNDLKVIVYKNNKLQLFNDDYELMRVNGIAYVRFFTDTLENDVIRIKAASATPKNENGYYEIAHNLERNPLNQNIISFTFGEVVDHVESIVESLANYSGTDYPGFSNLRDLGDVDGYGKRFVQHSGPANLALYHITDKQSNIINAINFGRNEYAKFKRQLLQTAESLDFDGMTKDHLDAILTDINFNKSEAYPFYFSDMVPYKGAKVQSYEVFTENNSFYALSEIFTLDSLSSHAVFVYLNDTQLTHGKDYTFNSEGFINVTATKQRGDVITLVEYNKTDGSFVPPTPSKLGIYPSWEPELQIDTTYQPDTEEYTVLKQKKIFGLGNLHSFVPNRLIKVLINGVQQTGNYTIESTTEGRRVVFNTPVDVADYNDQATVVRIEYPKVVIQGHDGSIVFAYNDYRDDILLEFEKRIYNNIKQAYDTDILDIHSFQGGEFRNTGFSKQAVEMPAIGDFVEWLKIAGDPDYTDHSFYEASNSFTYNYTVMSSPNGTPLKGFWRSVYKDAYDTDRPHSHPWEMLGFTVKPSWWVEKYGPAPYTSGNIVMWKDIEEGRIAEPNAQAIIKSQYIRPGLTSHLPVDSQGNLLSPLTSKYAKNFIASYTNNSFAFGDHTPVETAWRRSAEYPFALIKSWILNQPNKIFGIAFDISRTERNSSGNLVYTPTQKSIQLSELLFPNTVTGNTRTITSGLVNFVYNYMANDITTNFETYQSRLTSVSNQLALKVGGYTEKSKFNLILDSRTPLNEGNVFVPQENYQVFLGTSSPIETANYSAVIVERQSTGFVIRGYNDSVPVFKYFKPIEQNSDPSINVGGVSETFVDWDSGKQYIKGQNVRFNNAYYRCSESHVSGSTLDTTKFAKQSSLPLIGGRQAVLRRSYSNTVLELPYGSVFETIQEVIDFLLGYQSYLESQGFIFDSFNSNLGLVEDFYLSAKEFMFWTTQNWAAGSVISLSPFASTLKFSKDYVIADNIFDNFYKYSLLDSNGKELPKENIKISRTAGNGFELSVVNTSTGIYNVTLPLIQKEHVVLIDNRTVFDDVMYQPVSGYRQERVKVTGYRSDNWNGSLDVPGFIYDDAIVTDWETYKDYAVGDVVRYKEFYYTAKQDIAGSSVFVANNWERLSERPTSRLMPNFEYKINQFGDFYDLDSDNFDSEQQKFAQHLIGYQKRQYLQNIINDDVSQYKFYQGMIADKGTRNVLTKLFDALSSADKDSLEFYEEWAIKVGHYGAIDNYEEVEFILDETQFRISPQPIELVDSRPADATDLIYRQLESEVYSKPANYSHRPFPVKGDSSKFLRSPGYVNEDDVNFRIIKDADILTADIDSIPMDSYLWVAGDTANWDVLQHVNSTYQVKSFETFESDIDAIGSTPTPGVQVRFNTTVDLTPGEIIGIQGLLPSNNAFYIVDSVNNNSATLLVPNDLILEDEDDATGFVSRFRSVRARTSADFDSLLGNEIYDNQKIWLDDDTNNKWKVLNYKSVYNLNQEIANTSVNIDDQVAHKFGSAVTVDDSNLLLVTSDYTTDTVYPYRRASELSNFVVEPVLQNFNVFFIDSFTNDNPMQLVTVSDHGLESGQRIVFQYLSEDNDGGSSTLWNDLEIVKLLKRAKGFEVNVVDSTTVELVNVDGTAAEAEFFTRVASGVPEILSDGSVTLASTITVTDNNVEFGKGLAISPDGKYLAIGSPAAGNIPTRYKGEFDVDTSYVSGDIVRFQENLWRARIAIEPTNTAVDIETFNSYAFLEGTAARDDITLLLLGNPYIEQTTDHLLVRAPANQYEGSKSGDSAVLEWNKFTHLNRATGPTIEIQPFDNTIAEIKDTDISKSHSILEKIDNILVVTSYNIVPVVGDTIVTSTGQAKILDVYRDDFTLVMYTQGADETKSEPGSNGSFLESDEVYLGTELIGTYTQPTYVSDASFGGWWKVSINATINNTLTDIFDQPYWNDNGYGLVYKDFILQGTSTPVKDYYNIQHDVAQNLQDGYPALETSFIAPLAYRGDPNDILDNYDDDRFVLRLPQTTTYTAGDSFELWINNSEDSFDIADINIPFNVTNKLQTIIDVWDGYVDILYDNFQTVDEDGDGIGDPFEPAIGDIVFVSLAGIEAEVVYYQKDGLNSARLYLKMVDPTPAAFEVGATVVRKGDGLTIPNRVMGNITKSSLYSDRVGKLAVIQAPTNLDIDETFDGIYFEEFYAANIEYWFYEQTTLTGAARLPSLPASTNVEWTRVGNIPVDATDATTGPDTQGKFAIYERIGQQWEFVSEYVIPTSTTDSRVGEKIKFAKDKDLYRLYVVESAPAGEQKIHVVYNGTAEDGTSYDWDLSFDPNYRGAFVETVFYKQGEYVLHNSKMYQAATNIAAGAFNPTLWQEITSGVNYTASLPLADDLTFYYDNTYYADYNTTETTLETLEFAYDFDVNSDGSVLVVSIDTDIVGNLDNRVLVYRLEGNNYSLSQVIDSFAANTDFGESVSLNEDGTILAIGDSKNDTVTRDNGRVYIYKLRNNEFVLDQTLDAPRNAEVEKFGENVTLTGSNLFVSSYNGDMVTPTTFNYYTALTSNNSYILNPLSAVSQDATLFDGGFTTFKNKNIDSGVVNLFENVEDKFIYANNLKYFDVNASNFGESIVGNSNHVYVGMPRFTNEANGQIVEFRSDKAVKSWTTYREELPIVDVDKIKNAFLYNTKTGKLVEYLDYIDPVQGKIAGPAEQELYYKMFFDPALYNNTRIAGMFSDTNNWGQEQVGRLWWDLSTAKFKDAYQGNAIWQSNNWNSLIPGKSIDVYEWVESDVAPDDWDAVADTDEGTRRGISGQSKYGSAVFSQRVVYDEVGKNFNTKFYFWAKNKRTVPNIASRSTSAGDVANLILNPAAVGYKFVALMSDNRFVIHNCDNLINDKDIALTVGYYTQDNQEQNSHIEYQILSEGLETSLPKADVEQKWIDSLVGYDVQGRQVPDMELSPRNRYGNLNQPRQSWFINRFEALKQVVERANISLAKKIVVDEFSLDKLNDKDPLPLVTQRLYDVKVDTDDQLQFVGTSRAEVAQLSPVIEEGRIVAVSIVNPGRGYKDPSYVAGESTKRFGPSVTIAGTGTGAELELEIDNLGKVTNVTVLNQGEGYSENTTIFVRRLSVLVEVDTSIRNRWAIYQWNEIDNEWSRTDTQDYDVTNYWNYVDWYAEGYNQFSSVDYIIDYSYELYGLNDSIGDIIKISNVGTGGWLLLRKVDDTGSRDYTVDYETIGRQNGTVEIDSSLYDYVDSNVGFDSFIYDAKFYDNEPTVETRKILEALKDDILIDDLAADYNELFFASVRYVFAEQPNVDWAFKTSFVKAKHNVGELTQKVTYQNDNLSSYSDYIDEVKPFKTKIREYLSAYERTEETNSVVTDFDLPAVYDEEKKAIVPKQIRIVDNDIVGEEGLFEEYPDLNWLENVGFKITGIHITDPGRGYLTAPKVIIEGGGGTGAEAKAYVGRGTITNVVVTNPGSGYLSAPTVRLVSNVDPDTGVEAKLSAELGDTVVRSMHLAVKFDRITGDYTYTSLPETETFAGTAINTDFVIKWPMDLRTNKVVVHVDGIEMLRSEYTFSNVSKNSVSSVYEDRDFNYGADNVAAGPGIELIKSGYSQQQGVISFTNPPALDAVIQVSYYKDLSLLNASDRLYHFYKPTDGMLGNSPGILMEGVDYGGVEVRSFDFDGPAGWDTDGWYSTTWDTYDNTYEDEVFYLTDTTTTLELANPLEDGIVYNVYKDGVRIDDPNFGTVNPVTNPNAEMPSITGDGTTTIIDLAGYSVIAGEGNVFVVRKITSDGSFLPDPNSFDTLLTGGALDYSNAKGTSPEEMIVDGDGFVTATTSGGPEELVPGQVLDTVDIKVFERAGDGQGNIFNQNYVSDGTTVTYPLGIIPATNDSVIVKINSSVLEDSEFTIDYDNLELTLATAPSQEDKINILSIGASGNDVLDIDSFVTAEITTEFSTRVEWQDYISFFVTADGEVVATAEIEEDATGRVKVVVPEVDAIAEGVTVSYGMFVDNSIQQFSLVQSDSFTGDGSTTEFTLSAAPIYKAPAHHYTVVRVDDKILSAGYNKQFTVSTTREYEIDKFQYPNVSLQTDDVEVYLNGSKLENITQWTLNLGNNSVLLSRGTGQVGDILEVYVITDGEYSIADDTITFNQAPALDSVIEITQFSNHDAAGIERRTWDVVARSTLTLGSEESQTYNLLTGGKIRLTAPAKETQYVWIAKNGTLLTPNVDYSLNSTKTIVELVNNPAADDVIELIHFSDVQDTGRFAWRQFKDILNRTHYKRIDQTTRLAKALGAFDVRIEVEDASVLPVPDKAANRPGIVWIEGERIEYFIKDGNLLRQIRRGTLGTGVKGLSEVGTVVYNQGADNNVPYKDETITQVLTATEAQDTFALDFTPSSVNEFEVFVAGTRLRKTAISEFDLTIDQSSPAADVTIPAQFSIDGNNLVLESSVAETVLEGQKVMIIRKLGKRWTEAGVSIRVDDGNIAKFLRQGQTNLPK